MWRKKKKIDWQSPRDNDRFTLVIHTKELGEITFTNVPRHKLDGINARIFSGKGFLTAGNDDIPVKASVNVADILAHTVERQESWNEDSL